MTGAEWRTCGERVLMRRQLRRRRFEPLRWVKFNLACVERVRELIDDERSVRLIRLLEKFATDSDVYASWGFLPERAAAWEAVRDLWHLHGDPLRGARVAAARSICTAAHATYATSEMVAVAVGRWLHGRWRHGPREERRAHCALLRDVFGSPFRPVAFAPEWRTDTATALARGMYESRDFSAMPILADALQDAGCDSDAVLAHCRDASTTHVRGCWVVDLVLGRE